MTQNWGAMVGRGKYPSAAVALVLEVSVQPHKSLVSPVSSGPALALA